MSNVSPLGDHQYTYDSNVNYGFTGSWTSWSENVKCAICSATVSQADIMAHTSWHEDLRNEINEELKEMAMGLAVEVLKELAKQ